VRKHEGRDCMEDTGVDEKIILKWTLKNRIGERSGQIWLRTETSGGLL
jgi:hypothetical protein